MNVVVLHSGPLAEIVVASTVSRCIKKQPENINLTWVVPKCYKYIFRYSKDVDKTISFGDFRENGDKEYDLLINLWPNEVRTKAKVRDSTGFGFCSEFDKYTQAVLGNGSFPEISNFQLYFYLSGLTWKGEGYCIDYYPKTKAKKNRIGMSAANANLRNYVLGNLEIDDKKIWNIPYKQNIFKKMDEINRCKKIITDDLLTLHLALALRKYVYYLETYPHTFRLELFKNGQAYPVPYIYLK